MLGWVLVRRQMRFRKRVNRETRAAKRALHQIQNRPEPALPLSDAPVETQRWQVALFDLQRELKAELDTRIVIVQSLVRQLDERLEAIGADRLPNNAVTEGQFPQLFELLQQVGALAASGNDLAEISHQTELPRGDVELILATLRLSQDSREAIQPNHAASPPNHLPTSSDHSQA